MSGRTHTSARYHVRVHEKLRNAESRKGASFGALFGCALYLGIISRRRVHYEAIKYEREHNAGFLSPFGYSAATVAAAVDGVNSMEVCVDKRLEGLHYVLDSLSISCLIDLMFCIVFFFFFLSSFDTATDQLWQWYWLLALKCQTKNEGRYSSRIWRWKGYLIQVLFDATP